MLQTETDISKQRELLSLVYDAFNRRDIEPILAVMDPEVEWPNGMEGGWVHGREAVRKYWIRQWGMFDPHVYPVGFESNNEGRIVTQVHQVVRDLSGKVLMDRMVRHIYSINHGLIRRMDIQE